MSDMEFKVDQLVVYQNGNSFEIGKIKSLCDDGESAFVWYHGGSTAAKTSFLDIHPLRNAYLISETLLGGEPEYDSLLGCPFCGKTVEIVPEGDYVEIVCDDCGIAMSRGSELWLTEDWNRRGTGKHKKNEIIGEEPEYGIKTVLESGRDN